MQKSGPYNTDGYNKYMESIPLSPLFYKREERRVYEIIRGTSLLKFSTCWCSLLIRASFCGHRVTVYATQDWLYVAHAASRYKDIHAFTYIWWAYFYKEEKKIQEKQSRTQYPTPSVALTDAFWVSRVWTTSSFPSIAALNSFPSRVLMVSRAVQPTPREA